MWDIALKKSFFEQQDIACLSKAVNRHPLWNTQAKIYLWHKTIA